MFYPCYSERPVIFSLFFSLFFPFISHSCRFSVPTSRPPSFFRSGLHPAGSTGRRRMDTQIRCCCCCPFFLLDFLSETRISKENTKTERERGRNPEMDFMSVTFGWRHTTRERERRSFLPSRNFFSLDDTHRLLFHTCRTDRERKRE